MTAGYAHLYGCPDVISNGRHVYSVWQYPAWYVENGLTERIAALEAENEWLREALAEIALARGAYRIDPLEFATSVIEGHVKIAKRALSAPIHTTPETK